MGFLLGGLLFATAVAATPAAPLPAAAPTADVAPAKSGERPLSVGIFGGGVWTGSLASTIPSSSGFSVGATGSWAFSTYHSLDVSGAILLATSSCDECTLNAGIGRLRVTHHLGQSIAIQPWMSWGVGAAMVSVSNLAGTTSHTAIMPLNIAVGLDWAPLKRLGLGPVAELDLLRVLEPPQSGDPTLGASFTLALRGHWDLAR